MTGRTYTKNADIEQAERIFEFVEHNNATTDGHWSQFDVETLERVLDIKIENKIHRASC